MLQKATDLARAAESRIDERYILQQRTRIEDERYSDWKERSNLVNRIYTADEFRGGMMGRIQRPGGHGVILPSTVPTSTGLNVENSVKNATHDIADLASDARPMIKSIQRGEGDRPKKDKAVREGIAQTILWANRFHRKRKRLYMDMIGAGMAAVAAFHNSKSPYTQIVRLDPKGCFPTVRNDELVDMLYVEKVPLRTIRREYPELDLPVEPAWCDDEVEQIDYYDDTEVVKALVFPKGGKVPVSETESRVRIVSRWTHGLDEVPCKVAQLDTLDGAFRGLMDQAEGPLRARNDIVTMILDYVHEMVYASWEEKNILNATQPPGPTRIFRHDPNAAPGDSFMRRVPPAAPASAVFGIVSYMEQQTESEVNQPPARVGDVRQHNISGSFLTKSQGRLISVVSGLQEKFDSLLEDLIQVCFKIEEEYLDTEKPLWQSVGTKTVYMPSKDIDGWYYVRVDHGAAAGLDKNAADVRVLQHLGARLIDRGTAREQIDYLEDDTTIADRVAGEVVGDARLQRFAADPRTPLSALVKFELAIKEGKSEIEALKEALPAIEAEEQALREAALAKGGAVPQGGVVPSPEEQALALEKGETEEPLDLLFAQRPPVQQQFVQTR